ncbi:MAG: DUF6768 family protein [Verrucomicrobiota bacterium]
MQTDKELDDALHAAFREEDRVILEKYAEEPGVYEMLAETFRGKNRWLTIIAFVYTFVFLGFAIWCAIRFAHADADQGKALVGWGIGFVAAMNIVGLIKVWFWMDMQRHATTREIKRLELAIAHLSKGMRQS